MLTVFRRLVVVAGLVVIAGCGSSSEEPLSTKPLHPNDPVLQKIDPKKPPKLPSNGGQTPPRF